MPNVIITPDPYDPVTTWRVDRMVITPRALDPNDSNIVIQDYSAIIMLAFLKDSGAIDHYENIVLSTALEASQYLAYLSGDNDASLIEYRTALWLDANGKVPDSMVCPYITVTVNNYAQINYGEPISVVYSGNSGIEPYVFTITGTLPTGLTLDPDTGVLEGTPSVENEAYDFAVTCTDANGCSGDSASRTGNTGLRPATLDVTPWPTGVVGLTINQAYSQIYTASNGVAPYTWQRTTPSNTIPHGLTHDFVGATCTVYGTPTTGSNFTNPLKFKVTDSNGDWTEITIYYEYV